MLVRFSNNLNTFLASLNSIPYHCTSSLYEKVQLRERKGVISICNLHCNNDIRLSSGALGKKSDHLIVK
jgi:hypothetical protein